MGTFNTRVEGETNKDQLVPGSTLTHRLVQCMPPRRLKVWSSSLVPAVIEAIDLHFTIKVPSVRVSVSVYIVAGETEREG